ILSGALFGILFYKEKLTQIKILTLLLTAFGLTLIYLNQSGFAFSFYIFIAIIAGIGGSIWTVFSRPLSNTYSLTQMTVIDSALTFVMALVVSFLLREPWPIPFVNSNFNLLLFVAVFYLGMTQLFTGSLIARGFKTVDAQIGSIILLNDM